LRAHSAALRSSQRPRSGLAAGLQRGLSGTSCASRLSERAGSRGTARRCDFAAASQRARGGESAGPRVASRRGSEAARQRGGAAARQGQRGNSSSTKPGSERCQVAPLPQQQPPHKLSCGSSAGTQTGTLKTTTSITNDVASARWALLVRRDTALSGAHVTQVGPTAASWRGSLIFSCSLALPRCACRAAPALA
jgi:hypothetical protein